MGDDVTVRGGASGGATMNLASLPELGRGRDFIARRHGDLVIREPRTERAREKLVVERAVREAIAPTFPALVSPPIECDLPAPLFAVRFARGIPVVTPSPRFVDALARLVTQLHAMTDLPMTIDPTPGIVVRRFQTIVRERFLPRLSPEVRERCAAAALAHVPIDDLVACPQHGDLAARNLLVDDDGDLVAVLDWSDSVISDPAIDFGAIAQWGGEHVLDEILERAGRRDRALRERALIVGRLLDAID